MTILHYLLQNTYDGVFYSYGNFIFHVGFRFFLDYYSLSPHLMQQYLFTITQIFSQVVNLSIRSVFWNDQTPSTSFLFHTQHVFISLWMTCTSHCQSFLDFLSVYFIFRPIYRTYFVSDYWNCPRVNSCESICSILFLFPSFCIFFFIFWSFTRSASSTPRYIHSPHNLLYFLLIW